MEFSLANGIAWDTWRLDHLRAVEMNMYALAPRTPNTTADSDDPEIDTALSAALTFEKQSAKFALMSVYEQRLNRVIHKNLDEAPRPPDRTKRSGRSRPQRRKSP